MPGLKKLLVFVLLLGSWACAPEPPKSYEPDHLPKHVFPLELVQVLENFDSGRKGFQEPTDVALSSEGNIIVADSLNHRLVRLGPEGEFLASFGPLGEDQDHTSHPRVLALQVLEKPLNLSRGLGLRNSRDDLIYVCDDRGNLRILTPDFSMLDWDLPSEITSSHILAVDITQDSELLILQKNGRVSGVKLPKKLEAALSLKKLTFQFGGLGEKPGRFLDPIAIRALADGSFVVLDVGRIQRFSKEGKFLGPIGNQGYGAGGLLAPSDLAQDPQGRLVVTDLDSQTLEVFSPEGEYILSYDPRPAAGAGTHATALDIGDDGRLYLCDQYRHRILVMKASTDP